MKLDHKINMIEASCAAAALYVDIVYCHNRYHGPMQDFVHAYGHDVLAPFALVLLAQIPNPFPKKDSLFSAGIAAFLFSGYSIMEGAQALGLYHGTFDPYDFIAYAAGTGVALGMDRILCQQKKTLEKMVVE